MADDKVMKNIDKSLQSIAKDVKRIADAVDPKKDGLPFAYDEEEDAIAMLSEHNRAMRKG